MRNGPVYWIGGCAFAGAGHRAGHDADRAVAGVEVDRHLGQPRDLVERLEERLVADLQVERGVGHLGAELLAQVGDRVARLLLELLERLAQPDSLALDRDLARAGVDLVLGLAQGRAELLEPLLALGGSARWPGRAGAAGSSGRA